MVPCVAQLQSPTNQKQIQKTLAAVCSWGLYWATMPQELFRAEVFEEKHKDMLQAPTLVGWIGWGAVGRRVEWGWLSLRTPLPPLPRTRRR